MVHTINWIFLKKAGLLTFSTRVGSKERFSGFVDVRFPRGGRQKKRGELTIKKKKNERQQYCFDYDYLLLNCKL